MTDIEPLAIRVRGVTKTFGDVTALNMFSMDVWEGGIVSLLGPSGCGKTTALRVIAGFERPDTGTIHIRERLVVDDDHFVQPDRRRVGMVFQDYALFPHLTVTQNVGYGVTDETPKRVTEVLELVGLSGLGDRMPHELSGGQQQRVALARALAPRPEVILLDEPFSNLDTGMRQRVRREVRTILLEARTTAVLVTHDQEEALAMSDMVAVMRAGTIVQAGPPDELYLQPADRWVASFLGDADFVSGVAAGGKVSTPAGDFHSNVDGPVEVMIRPEMVSLIPDAGATAHVVGREFFGHDQLYTVLLPGGGTIRARTGPTPVLRLNEAVTISVSATRAFAV